MAIKKDFLEGIQQDVSDVLATKFEYLNTNNVPTRSDAALTFERGVLKRGKILKTCVIYVDIRNSVELTSKHSAETMGQLYTAFGKSMVKAAKQHNGHVRNIIGDRVMIIFPVENCFVNAFDCALSINYIASEIINKQFSNVDFKCGIGIDYGELKVIKVGRQRRGDEAVENRSLVWTGFPANIASRLTDVANKIVKETYFQVIKQPYNPYSSPLFNSLLATTQFPLSAPSNQPTYSAQTQEIELTAEEFIGKLEDYKGELKIGFDKVVSFKKLTRNISFPAILMTEIVYKGIKNADPNRKSFTNSYLLEQKGVIKNVKTKVYGGDILWGFN